MSYDTEEWCKIWRKTDLLFQKWQEFGEVWSEHSVVSKLCTLIGPFCGKHITFDLKKYREVIFHDTELSCRIWRKTSFWFGKWHEKFSKFWPEHSKVSKLGLWWDPFIQIRKCISPKYAGELCVMTMKNDANLKRNWQFKTGTRNLTNISRALENLKNLHFNGLLLTKVYNFELREYRGLMFDGLNINAKVAGKLDLCFQKWHEEFGKFLPERSTVSKLGLWWGPFIQSRKCMSLKFTAESCVMTMKNDAKFEEELTCQFNTDMRNLTNFDRSTWKSQKFPL